MTFQEVVAVAGAVFEVAETTYDVLVVAEAFVVAPLHEEKIAIVAAQIGRGSDSYPEHI